jgi:hypothetical protein
MPWFSADGPLGPILGTVGAFASPDMMPTTIGADLEANRASCEFRVLISMLQFLCFPLSYRRGKGFRVGQGARDLSQASVPG